MMRMTHKLVFTAACLAIFSTAVVKPAGAIDNNISGELLAQSFNEQPIIEEKSQTSNSSQKTDAPEASSPKKDDSFLVSFLWGLGGYLIGSLVGTNKTYTKMNKGR